MAYTHVWCVQVLVSLHFCFSLYRSLNIFTSLSCIAICSIYLNVSMNEIHYFLLCGSLFFFGLFFNAKSSAFCFFVHISHGSSCSIKEKIVLLNAPSSGTYGVWCPVNGGRLEALWSKTFIDEFSISLWGFTVWWISGFCGLMSQCICGLAAWHFCLELERWFRSRWRHGKGCTGTNAFLSFTAAWACTFQQLEWVNIQINPSFQCPTPRNLHLMLMDH